MISYLKSLFIKKSVKKIAFLDGDQSLPLLIDVHSKHLKGVETHLVRSRQADQGEPRPLRKLNPEINKIYLSGYSPGKEVSDKFITGYIQKAISESYQEIIVVSSDFDFIDIFKMTLQLNPDKSGIKMKLIVPQGRGKILDYVPESSSIEIELL